MLNTVQDQREIGGYFPGLVIACIEAGWVVTSNLGGLLVDGSAVDGDDGGARIPQTGPRGPGSGTAIASRRDCGGDETD